MTTTKSFQMMYYITLCLKGYQKNDKSKLKVQLFKSKYIHIQIRPAIFLIPFEVQGHTVPHWKALRYSKYESRGLSCDSTSSICQVVLKSDNLLHKQSYVKAQSLRTIILGSCIVGPKTSLISTLLKHSLCNAVVCVY